MAIRIQELIHKYEVGAGSKIVKFTTIFIAMIALAVCYDWLAYRNMTTADGMDAAQVGRRIAEGKGFSTSFIRPFSIHLLEKRALAAATPSGSLQTEKPVTLPA